MSVEDQKKREEATENEQWEKIFSLEKQISR